MVKSLVYLIIRDFTMTAILERRESESLWGRFCNWITSTENRLYIGWVGVLMNGERSAREREIRFRCSKEAHILRSRIA
jgi:hypothetical protein